MELQQVAADFAVRPQITPSEVAGIAAAGFKGIVNARPDGEAPDQPPSKDIEAEAKRHGLAYCHIPVVPGAMSKEQARAFAKALAAAGGPVLGFCRTGTRAANLWKLAHEIA